MRTFFFRSLNICFRLTMREWMLIMQINASKMSIKALPNIYIEKKFSRIEIHYVVAPSKHAGHKYFILYSVDLLISLFMKAHYSFIFYSFMFTKASTDRTAEQHLANKSGIECHNDHLCTDEKNI